MRKQKRQLVGLVELQGEAFPRKKEKKRKRLAARLVHSARRLFKRRSGKSRREAGSRLGSEDFTQPRKGKSAQVTSPTSLAEWIGQKSKHTFCLPPTWSKPKMRKSPRTPRPQTTKYLGGDPSIQLLGEVRGLTSCCPSWYESALQERGSV